MILGPAGESWVYHLALRDEWLEALTAGVAYRRSTLGKSLGQEGFIHCSFAHQVKGVADLVYSGRRDVVLLTIDASRLGAELKVEKVGGGDQSFPHVYGPLPLDAVVLSSEVPVDIEGRLALEALLQKD